MFVLFVRHGKAGPPARPEEGTLTEEGIRQAELTAKTLEGQDIERLFSSPYPRAMQTALIISRRLGLPVEIRHRMHEKTGPGGARQTKSDIERRFPQFVIPEEMPEEWWPDHEETWEDVYERVKPVVEEFKGLEGTHERIVAVAHGGSIDAMLSVWVDAPPMEKARFYHHNCCFSLVSYKEGRGRIHYVNQVAHMGERELFFY